MIAAGTTGINPMVQMIRDYINPDSHSHGVLLGAHSRLVLLWQNNEEGDLFCADELTTLQAEAKGLLEVTVILSGDKTRRNVPGIAFRRAKARLIKKGGKAGLANRGAGYRGDTDGGTGDQASGRATSSGAEASSELKQEDKDKVGDELIRGAQLYRHKIARALSRVSEEDSMSLGSSFVTSSRTFGGRDLESGGDGSSFRSPMVLCKGVEEKAPTGVGGGGGNKELPWSPICGGRTGGSESDSGRTVQTLTELRKMCSDPRRHKEASQSTGRSDSARGPSIAAHVADCSLSFVGGGEDGRDSGGEDSGDEYGSPIPLRHSRGDVRSTCSSPTLSRQEAIRDLSDASSDMSGCVSEGARTYNGSSCEKVARGAIHLMGPFSRASVGRGRWLQSVRKKESTGQANGGSGDGGGGKLVRPTLHQSSSSKIDIVEYNPDEEVQSEATTVAGSCGRPSCSHRRGSSKKPSSPSGVNTHSNSAPTRTRRESSRNSSSRDMAAEHLPRSSLEDSGSGLQHTTISTAVVEKAIGPEVMKAIASLEASEVAGAVQEESTDAADGSRSALNTLIGTDTTGGALQVVVSGPAGFVFYVEGLLAEMSIPPQAVVLLD